MTRARCLGLAGLVCVASTVAAAQTPANNRAADLHVDLRLEMHAYALAELGRHAEAIKAFEALQPTGGESADDVGGAIRTERAAYERALRYSQDCVKDKSCMAEDFLAIGKPADALSWQKRRLNAIDDAQSAHLRKGEELDGGGMTVRTGDEHDMTGGRSAELADALDLRARIEAAMGETGAAMKDLDAAVKALPETAKSAPRQAGYEYHRALMLAEDRQYAKAAAACEASLKADETNAVIGERRSVQCAAINTAAAAAVH